ncbi:methyltransferase domain-containing protein [bacterium]|nr:methyltransferase domain-containing protein [bacterium]
MTLGVGSPHSIFTHIEGGATKVDAIAKAAGLSLRGTQALLDGLVGIGMLDVKNGTYSNTSEASFYLVEGKPAYMGGWIKLIVHGPVTKGWLKLDEAVKTGEPRFEHTADEAENPMWEELVLGIAPLAVPVAQIVAERTGIAKMAAPSILDVGGGSGVFSAILLAANPNARATQLDWANVNAIARAYVAKHGVGDRFKTRDGDFHTEDFGSAEFDLAILSNIAHQESPRENVAILKKLKKALKENRALVVSDFVLHDDRTGHPFALLFNANMLLATKAGAAWRQADYRAWLSEAGFAKVTFEATPTPSTLIVAWA